MESQPRSPFLLLIACSIAMKAARRRGWLVWLLILVVLGLALVLADRAAQMGWTAHDWGPVQALAFDREGNTWISEPQKGLKRRTANGQWQDYTGDHSELPTPDVQALAVDARGRVWVDTPYDGLGVLYLDGRWESHPLKNILGRVLAFAVSPEGDLWVGTSGGLARLDSQDHWTNFTGAIGARQEGDSIPAVAVDPSGRVWVAASGGLGYLDQKGQWFTVSPKSLNISALAADANGRIWAATQGALLELDESGNVVTNYTQDNSPLQPGITDMNLDPQGNLWIAAGRQRLYAMDLREALPSPVMAGIGLIRKWGPVLLGATVFAGLVLLMRASVARLALRRKTGKRPAWTPGRQLQEESAIVRPRTLLQDLLVLWLVYTLLCSASLLIPPLGLAVIFRGSITVESVMPEMLYAALAGLISAVPTWLIMRLSRRKKQARWLRYIAVAIFPGVALLLVISRSHLPDGPWNQLPRPPASLVKLVKTSPISALGGDVYGATGEGLLFGYFCWFTDKCQWQAVDTLPPPPDPASYWSGSCQPGREQRLLWLEPPAPASALDRLATFYCGPDYEIETHFLLTADGNVWSIHKWAGWWEGLVLWFGQLPAAVVCVAAGALWTLKRFRSPITV